MSRCRGGCLGVGGDVSVCRGDVSVCKGDVFVCRGDVSVFCWTRHDCMMRGAINIINISLLTLI